MSVNKVLNEVDLLFQKINSLPEDVRQAAINKIQENMSPPLENVLVPKPRVGRPLKKSSTSIPVPNLRPMREGSKRIQKQKGSMTLADDLNEVYNETQSSLTTNRVKAKTQVTKIEKSAHKQKASKKVPMTPDSAGISSHLDVFNESTQSSRNIISHRDLSKGRKSSSKPFKKRQFKVLHVDVLASSNVEDFQVSQQTNNSLPKQQQSQQNTTSGKQRNKKSQVYKCPICDLSFKLASNLKIHMKRHKNQRDFKCVNCPYRSITKCDMECHMVRIHTQVKDMICEYCAKDFALKKSLLQHIRTMHTTRITQFYCAQCPFTTNQKNNLRVHIRIRHLGDYDTHVCPVCDAKVRLKCAFLDHIKTHTGDRPFQCEICSASFASVGRLNTHRRTLHAPRQFACNTCDKMFPTKYSLERHMNVHTNGKPHSCPFCEFSCNMQGNLTKHIRNIHRKPDFSLREYKKQLQATEADKVTKHPKQWTAKGQKACKKYLNNYSKTLGRKVTVTQLKAQEKSRQKEENEAKEKAKIERINRITSKEHSYVLKPAPSPVPISPEPLNNIYLEAIAAANLDFTTSTLVDSIPILDPRQLLVEDRHQLLGEELQTSSFIMPDEDPLLLTYSDVLQVPGLEHLGVEQGLEHLSVEPSLVQIPNLFVQLPSGEKVQCSVNMLRDLHQLGDSCGMVDTPLLTDGLLPVGMDFQSSVMPSVMIVVGDALSNQGV